MSIKFLASVWEKSVHCGPRLLLLLAIADHADENGLAWPGMESLASKTRLDKRNLWRTLGELCDSGELLALNREGQRTNMYIIVAGSTEKQVVAAWDRALALGAIGVRGQKDLSIPDKIWEVVSGRHYRQGDTSVSETVEVPSGRHYVVSPGRQGSVSETVEPSFNHHESSSEPLSADAAPEAPVKERDPIPTSFEGWLARIENPPADSNRTAQLVAMHLALFPSKDAPDYGYMGKTAKTVGGAGRMAALMWQSAGARITGDPLRYCLGIHRREKPKRGGNGVKRQETLSDSEAAEVGAWLRGRAGVEDSGAAAGA